MDIRELFDDMWDLYARVNPQVVRVKELMEEHEGGSVKNDHIALRTFNHPRINRHVLAKPFLDSGYKETEDLAFEKKKLDATYYLHDDEDLTRVFISELKLEEFSPELQATIDRLVDEIPDEAIERFDFCNYGIPWNMITKETYDFLKTESEYAAWVATFGFIVNHLRLVLRIVIRLKILNKLILISRKMDIESTIPVERSRVRLNKVWNNRQ